MYFVCANENCLKIPHSRKRKSMTQEDTQLFNLKGSVAVITGGSGALGFEIAGYLLSQQVKVALLARNIEKLRQAADKLQAHGDGCLTIPTDVTQKSTVEEAATQILDKWGKVDILINAAGGNTPGAVVNPEDDLFELSLKEFAEVAELNLQGAVIPSMVFARHMCENKRGSIINFSSMSVERAITRVAGYSAGKAGLENFTRWLACEIAMRYGEGIRVNAIAPGFFIGEQNKSLLTNTDGKLTERGQQIISLTPMGRFGQAEELNGVIHFLSSRASSFVTGTVIPIDGGFNAFSGV